MLPHSLTIKSLKASIVIKSDQEKDIKKLKASVFLKRYIPNAVFLEQNTKPDCGLIIKKGKARIDLKYPQAIYYNNQFNEKDLVSLAEYLLERARQENGLYCIHGSACLVNNKAVIFWGGASGMGKTTLCKKIQEKYGANWFADEKIVIDFSTGRVVGWVDIAYLKEGKNKFKKLSTNNQRSIPIAFFIYPLLTDDSCSKLLFDKWSAEKFRWHLFEESNRKIRATSRSFFNSEPIMPIDTIKLARKRIEAIKKITNKTKCYFMRGNSDGICKKINSLL